MNLPFLRDLPATPFRPRQCRMKPCCKRVCFKGYFLHNSVMLFVPLFACTVQHTRSCGNFCVQVDSVCRAVVYRFDMKSASLHLRSGSQVGSGRLSPLVGVRPRRYVILWASTRSSIQMVFLHIYRDFFLWFRLLLHASRTE